MPDLPHSFFSKFGAAANAPDPQDTATLWNGSRCKLFVEIKDGMLDATGSYMVESGALERVFLSSQGVPPPSQKKMLMRIYGRLFGKAAICKLRIWEEGKGAISTTISGKDKNKILLAFADEFDSVAAYEPDAPKSARFYAMTLAEN